MATAELAIQITAKDAASKAFKDAEKAAGGFGNALSDVGKIAAGFLAGNLIQGGLSKLTGFFGESIDAAKESAAVQAQLQAALKSTSKETVTVTEGFHLSAEQISDHNRKVAELTLSVRAAHEAQIKAKSGSLDMAQARLKETNATADLNKENANFAALQSKVHAATTTVAHGIGMTIEELNKMSSALQDQTNFDDEAIGGAQALLLTFTSIGKDVFPGATAAVLDMSQALGQDLKSSSIQLGKALNDPTQGMTALRRVGVSFSEDQQKVIKNMQATGNLAGAQKLILEELNKEFGGSAAAAVKADGGITQLKNKMNDLQETIGAKLIPIQVKFKQLQFDIINFLVSKGLPAFEDLSEKYMPQISAAFDQAVEAVTPFIDQIQPFFEALSQNEEVMNKVAVVVGGVLVAAFAALAISAGAAAVGVVAALLPFIAIGAAVAALALGVRELVIHWDEINAKFPIIGQAVAFVKEQFADLKVYWDAQLLPALTRIKDRFVEVVTAVVGFVQQNWPLIKDIMIGAVTVAYDWLKVQFDLIAGLFRIVIDVINGDWDKAWKDLKTLAVDAVKDALALLKDAFSLWKDLGKLLYEVGAALIQGLWNGMKDKFNDVKDWLGDKLGDIKDTAMKVLGIHSPSTVMRRIGEQTMEGLNDGMVEGSKGVLATVENIGSQIKQTLDKADLAAAARNKAAGVMDMYQWAEMQKTGTAVKQLGDGTGYYSASNSLQGPPALTGASGGSALFQDLVRTMTPAQLASYMASAGGAMSSNNMTAGYAGAAGGAQMSRGGYPVGHWMNPAPVVNVYVQGSIRSDRELAGVILEQIGGGGLRGVVT